MSDRYSHTGRPQISTSNNWDNITKEITDLENVALIKSVSNREIKVAAFHLDTDKSPGPDGFPAEFFQHYWSTVGGSVWMAVRAFFHSVNYQ